MQRVTKTKTDICTEFRKIPRKMEEWVSKVQRTLKKKNPKFEKINPKNRERERERDGPRHGGGVRERTRMRILKGVVRANVRRWWMVVAIVVAIVVVVESIFLLET